VIPKKTWKRDVDIKCKCIVQGQGLSTHAFTNVVMPCRLNALMDSPARFAGAEISIVCRLVAFPGASRDITWTWVAFGARMYKKLKES
jgi:hypothetical protein